MSLTCTIVKPRVKFIFIKLLNWITLKTEEKKIKINAWLIIYYELYVNLNYNYEYVFYYLYIQHSN